MKLRITFELHPQKLDTKVYVCRHPTTGCWGCGGTPKLAYEDFIYWAELEDGLHA